MVTRRSFLKFFSAGAAGLLVPELLLPQKTFFLPPIGRWSNQLKARWTIESMQSLASVHGLDLETEISTILLQEINAEVIKDVIIKCEKSKVPILGGRSYRDFKLEFCHE